MAPLEATTLWGHREILFGLMRELHSPVVLGIPAHRLQPAHLLVVRHDMLSVPVSPAILFPESQTRPSSPLQLTQSSKEFRDAKRGAKGDPGNLHDLLHSSRDSY
ncbi:hypothetical protein KIL84_010765 [Mauremys mutica]|uniref:Uncharacterized protein n=1 Tax=Mauremys mutica TaxID=74926 RepID=A0A9D3XC76_9SAUR|nr:hypothetical protein KIL84_010765 [Mauremys mutica]